MQTRQHGGDVRDFVDGKLFVSPFHGQLSAQAHGGVVVAVFLLRVRVTWRRQQQLPLYYLLRARVTDIIDLRYKYMRARVYMRRC